MSLLATEKEVEGNNTMLAHEKDFNAQIPSDLGAAQVMRRPASKLIVWSNPARVLLAHKRNAKC
ncbi:hypothetical protein N7528_009359 [Penicillium herquei]|nr:hypothetical protein N7528_009359 [Penicillium herquei]